MKRRAPALILSMVVTAVLAGASKASAQLPGEIWVAPTSQADFGGLGVASNVVWPVTPAGAVRFAFPIPDALQSLQSAKLVLIPETSSGSSTLTVYVCPAINGTAVVAACHGPFNQAFTSTANQLKEIDITSTFVASLGIPGTRTYVAVLAFTSTAASDHFVGLRVTPDLGVRTDDHLTVLGSRSYTDETTGSSNTAIGVEVMRAGWQGDGNTAIGEQAMAGGPGSTVNTGNNNTAVGHLALNQTMSGSNNVAIGQSALLENTTGSDNVAIGSSAVGGTGGGLRNIAIGSATLLGDFVRNDNVVIGHHAGRGGLHDTAIGSFTLQSTPTQGGNDSIAIGYRAGFNSLNGSFNIHIGNEGLQEWNTLRIGTAFDAGPGSGQNRAFIAGIRGTTTGAADAIPVVVDSNGQLGTISSSRRFKEDIRDMDDASRRLFDLRPVTFRYAQAYQNGTKPTQYGLVAEEVAAAFPDLAVRNSAGEIETVHYETLNVLLLNEVQKQQRRIDTLEQELAQVRQILGGSSSVADRQE